MPYHTLEELIDLYLTLEREYPGYVSHEVAGKSTQNRDIYLFKIGKDRGDKFLIEASMHGNEHSPAEVLYLYAKWLFSGSEDIAEEILNRMQTLIVPVANPDGFVSNTRKTVNGVDPNRNFPYKWCQCGSSTNPSSPTYKGREPLSEPETVTVHNLFERYKPKWYLSMHSGVEVIAYPWCYTNTPPPHKDYYDKICMDITNLARERGVEPYRFGQVPLYKVDLAEPEYVHIGGQQMIIYCCSGVSIDDSYSMGIYSMVLEVSSPYNPSYDRIVNHYFPRFLPIAITISKECFGPTPTPTRTFVPALVGLAGASMASMGMVKLAERE